MKRCLILFVMMLSGRLMAQEIHLERTIHWKGIENSLDDSVQHAYLNFENAVFVTQEDMLPRFFELIPVPSPLGNFHVQLEKAFYETPDSAEMEIIEHNLNPDTSISIRSGIAVANGNTYLQLCFVPMRINQKSKRPEKLIHFTLVIVASPEIKSGKIKSTVRYANSSVLADGAWYKVKVTGSGIYKFTFSQLKDMGLTNPEHVHIYGNGGAQLPIMNSDPRIDDLQELPIWFEKGGDSIFNSGDFILFYAEGPQTWTYSTSDKMFEHINHTYSDASYYFITESDMPAKTMTTIDPSMLPPTHDVTIFNDYAAHELDKVNLIHSGSEWYGENFDAVTSLDIPFEFPNLVPGDSAILSTRALARYSYSTTFSIFNGNQSLGSITLDPVSLTTTTGNYASVNTGKFIFYPTESTLHIILNYNKTGKPAAEGWLDYLIVNVRRQLIMSGDQMRFRYNRALGAGEVGRFLISNASSNMLVWDITDLHAITNLAYSLNSGILEFKQPTNEIREYIAFRNDADFPSPVYQGEGMGLIPNQDLHGTSASDLVIVTHPDFLSDAEKLAQLHRDQDGLRVTVVTTDQVYNEFSSGAPDAAAIRDFVKMLYDKASTIADKPCYLLLFGDGSYDNKHANRLNPNFIPTYQSPTSLSGSGSFVTDDFYALLDDDEGGSTGLLDIGVGRLPVKTVDESNAVVAKIIRYTDPANKDDWRNLISFIGDDEDGNTHMTQADDLAKYVEANYPSFAIEKIYLDAYQQHTSSIGQTYPDVNSAIEQRINKGVLIFNYTGHGNEIGLAHEKILQMNDIKQLKNKAHLPLFVTATCEFSRFDDVSISGSQYNDATSAGEWLLLNPDGGGVALLSTTRLVYSGPNYYLNDRFYHYVFEHDGNDQKYRLGDIIKLSKNSSGPGINKLNFTLLGDPALSLAYPVNTIETDSVNGTAAGIYADTLKAFTRVNISGHIDDPAGNLLFTANGYVYPEVFDKASTINTLNNDGNGVMTFATYNSLLFKGKAQVTHGQFEFNFIIPKDINYRVDFGKIIYYACDSMYDAHGNISSLLVGGYDPFHTPDGDGPNLHLYMNDTNFISGGITDENPVLLARVSDASGINTTGSGIGHDIIGILDGETRITLNDFYQADLNSYTSGNIRYPLLGLSLGKHNFSVRVWDIYDNSAVESVDFLVTNSGVFIVKNLLNFPNPIGSYTEFAFSHNKPGDDLEVELSIYDLSGQCIKIIKAFMNTEGYSSAPLYWDCTSDSGAPVAQGLYIYRVRVQASDSQVADAAGKLLIVK